MFHRDPLNSFFFRSCTIEPINSCRYYCCSCYIIWGESKQKSQGGRWRRGGGIISFPVTSCFLCRPLQLAAVLRIWCKIYSTLIPVPQIQRRPLTATTAPSHRLMQVFVTLLWVEEETPKCSPLSCKRDFFYFFSLHLLETRNLDIDKRLRDPASATRSLWARLPAATAWLQFVWIILWFHGS